MAPVADSNPISYLIQRQIDDKVDQCKRLVNARFEYSENLFRKDLLSHYGCVNAIEFSNQGDLLVSGGDDRRVLLWRVEQAIQDFGKPVEMKAQHISNIFCLGYDNSKTKIFSAGNDDQVIVHDLRTADVVNFFLHDKPVYGLSVHPHNDNVFASACDDGRVLIYDIRASSAMETFCLAKYKTAFHSVMFNPVEPKTLATANAREGIAVWDVRKPLQPVLRYAHEGQSCMNVRFNSAGNRLLALRRRLPPILYAIDPLGHLCQFDHPGYYNSCTMKSCCFAGDNDEYVLSGSDDFNLYMWKIPNEDVGWVHSAHMVLRGHRSIVNQVRYNSASCIFASSGVEKLIKIWSPFPLGNNCLGGLKRDDGRQERQRKVFTHDEYIGLVLHSGRFMTHDYSHQSTREDPRMMAFFDSLVQREIEGWSSEDILERTLSDFESNAVAGRAIYSETDSDVNLASDGPSEGGVAPERPLESPNRITRLIAYRREQLLRLASTNTGASNPTNNHLASEPSSDEASGGRRKFVKSKGAKRKSERRGWSRRKCAVLQINSDSETDEEAVDTAQPSTSSGVVFRRTTSFFTKLIEKKSSSSSEDEKKIAFHSGKFDKTKRRCKKSKNSCAAKGDRCKWKGGSPDKRKEWRAEPERRKDWRACANGGPRPEEGGPSTPRGRLRLQPSTPDSGITSSISTNEKSNGAENQESDQGEKMKSVEHFRKKIDVAKRSYRSKAKNVLILSSSESSD